MEQPPNISPQNQQELNRFQTLKQQLDIMVQQKSTIERQLREAEYAIKELESAGENATVYKSAGGIFIKSDREYLLNSSKDRKEELGIKLNSISKQVDRIKSQYDEQANKVQEIMKKYGYS
ncbi:MAG: prefoldin subunit beta [Promethearchaeota archaeon]